MNKKFSEICFYVIQKLEQHMHTTRHTFHSHVQYCSLSMVLLQCGGLMGHLGLYSLRQAKKSTTEEAPARQIPLHSHDR